MVGIHFLELPDSLAVGVVADGAVGAVAHAQQHLFRRRSDAAPALNLMTHGNRKSPPDHDTVVCFPSKTIRQLSPYNSRGNQTPRHEDFCVYTYNRALLLKNMRNSVCQVRETAADWPLLLPFRGHHLGLL